MTVDNKCRSSFWTVTKDKKKRWAQETHVSVDHILNWLIHCSTATLDVQRTSVRFFTVHAIVTPVSVLPAPQGSTMTPLLPRPLPNILARDFSCGRDEKQNTNYGRELAAQSKGEKTLPTSTRTEHV
jgi:hypothetical protein